MTTKKETQAHRRFALRWPHWLKLALVPSVVAVGLGIIVWKDDLPFASSGQAQQASSDVPNGDHAPTNLLIDETSPYLLQHAHNPVNWHPWGEEAFAKAKRENKPIFLSVGYSTCYWCPESSFPHI